VVKVFVAQIALEGITVEEKEVDAVIGGVEVVVPLTFELEEPH
jgi:hypothetical protein